MTTRLDDEGTKEDVGRLSGSGKTLIHVPPPNLWCQLLDTTNWEEVYGRVSYQGGDPPPNL